MIDVILLVLLGIGGVIPGTICIFRETRKLDINERNRSIYRIILGR